MSLAIYDVVKYKLGVDINYYKYEDFETALGLHVMYDTGDVGPPLPEPDMWKQHRIYKCRNCTFIQPIPVVQTLFVKRDYFVKHYHGICRMNKK